METLYITKERFLSFSPIKQDIVHREGSLIYKHDTESKRVVERLDQHRNDPEFHKILIPEIILYEEHSNDEYTYFGYASQYYKNLRNVIEEIKKRRINPSEYFKELLVFIEYLNERDLLYWDFHQDNIVVKDKKPFILDIDDIAIGADNSDRANQREFLTEFILNTFLNCRKSVIGFKNDPTIKAYFTHESLDYMSYTFECSDEHILPYCILEELSDEEKVAKIKKIIRR